MEVKTTSLEQRCEMIVDCPHSTPEWTEQGVVVLRSQNIKNGTLNLSQPSYTNEDGYKERTRRAIPSWGDLVITREAPMGEICRIPERLRCCLGQRQVLIRPKSNPDYILYAIQSPYVQKQIRGHNATGSTVSNLCIPDLKALRIPELPNEAGVAKVLATLDAKIELNQRINAELEGMAKLLYDYWFVQFDFPMSAAQAAALGKPDLVGQPYRASGGLMVYNQSLKREIPEGWEAKSLSRLIRVTKESVNPADLPDKSFKLFSIPVFDSTGTYFIETGAEIGSNKFIVTGSDILVSKLNPWFSRVIFTESEINAVCSTEFVVWQTTASWMKAFLYMVARSPQFVSFCTRSATGTSNSHKRVSPDVMMSHAVAWQESVVQAFGERVNPMLLARQVNQQQNQELTRLRDWLLPMLMNGQVTVESQ